ncbi:MAG: hypothetical protein LBS26_02440 [Campylobacteraceae bacterium]|jgi:hypothetical protein|nr:hypothetical protein [Campylobacteraceae bacterium]
MKIGRLELKTSSWDATEIDGDIRFGLMFEFTRDRDYLYCNTNIWAFNIYLALFTKTLNFAILWNK